MRFGFLTVLFALPALAGPLIVVDPGHGGNQDGAYSQAGTKEKQLSLEVALKLKTALEALLKAKVRMTREQDVAVQLPDRVKFANDQKPDLFVSVHLNSMPTKKARLNTQGIETYFLNAAASGEDARKTAARENAEFPQAQKGGGGDTLSFILADLQRSETHADSSRLAYAVHEKLIAATGASDRGVQQAPFYVLMGLDAPAVLVEIGFISHPEEGVKLSDPAYQTRVAEAIAVGVQTFLLQIGGRDAKTPQK
jgi:N-acetylmuramoyl-L-alanine amidase